MKRVLRSGFKLLGLMTLILATGHVRCFAQGACPSAAPVSGNHCYFISSAMGSDSNNGTSENTPWAHAPGMSNCSSTCAGVTPTGGEAFVFRGCDTWNFATIGQWSFTWSGSSSSSMIYIGGFDQTWYNTSACPSSWNRPIFSGEGTWPGSAGPYAFLNIYGQNYWRVAWIEFTGLYWTGGNSDNYITAGQAVGFEIDHNYLHGWSYGAFTNDAFLIEFGGPTPGVTAGEVDHNVCSGYDTVGQDSGACIAGGLSYGEIDHNWLGYSDNCIGGGTYFLVHDNTFQNCGALSAGAPAVHNNTYEQNADPSTGSISYNNYMTGSGTAGRAVVNFQIAPPGGGSDWAFNNVIVNYVGNTGDPPISCYGGGGGGTCYIFNNTIEGGPDSGPPSTACFRNGDGGATTSLLSYNFCITSDSSIVTNSAGTVTQTPDPNLTQTLSAAEAQGYDLANSFSPQSASGATVGAGYSPSALVSICNTIAAVNSAAGTACQYSSTLGVTLVTSPYYAVGGSTLTAVPRLTTGSTNNDAGAYTFGSGTTSQPNPPSGLVATVQ